MAGCGHRAGGRRVAAAVGLAGALGLAGWTSLPAAEVRLERREDGSWQMLRGGVPWEIRGAGGTQHLEEAAALGVNTIRTWGADQLQPVPGGLSLLDRAHELGLDVVVGLWIQHERHGFDYGDSALVEAQRAAVRAWVRTWRDHPAVLVWGLGNEMEGHGPKAAEPRIWRELEILARIIKEEDPHHPVMTALAGVDEGKIDAIKQWYPSLDILGVNLYGGAERLPDMLTACGWDRPFMLTEFGPHGPWEVPKTDWGAPLEPTTREKVEQYARAHRTAWADPAGRCLGTFGFLWGHKQEATATWFGMFLPTGEKTPVVDQMSHWFLDRWPENRSPWVESAEVPLAGRRLRPGEEVAVRVHARDPEGDPLALEWRVVEESSDRKGGGDREAAPPEVPGCLREQEGFSARVRAPERAGAYRLFVFVRDGRGGGSADNYPFYVE